MIGGQTPAERNVISGNGGNGLALESPGTSGNQVLGNYIGTDVAGSHAVPNTLAGVYLHGGANENTIGTDAAGNLISGNRGEGILLLGTDFIVTDNRIAGNRIGSDASGATPVPNNAGIKLDEAADNLIGGADAAAGNLIAFNRTVGLAVEKGTGNVFQKNTVSHQGGLAAQVTLGNPLVDNQFLGQRGERRSGDRRNARGPG